MAAVAFLCCGPSLNGAGVWEKPPLPIPPYIIYGPPGVYVCMSVLGYVSVYGYSSLCGLERGRIWPFKVVKK